MPHKLIRKLKDDEIHARLLNWGSWLRWDNTIARLGYPTQCPFVFSPRKGAMVADIDAEHIEWIVSSLHVSELPLGVLYAFVLKVEYAERPDKAVPHVSQRAGDVRRRFRRPCAERTYYHHLAKAKRAVTMFAGPIQ